MLRFLNDPRLNKRQQSARLCKVFCPACGYTMRITRKWLEVAVPVCPNPDCGRVSMSAEVPSLPDITPEFNILAMAMEAGGGVLPLTAPLLSQTMGEQIPVLKSESKAFAELRRLGLSLANITADQARASLGLDEPVAVVRFRRAGQYGAASRALVRLSAGDPVDVVRGYLASHGIELKECRA